jgi:pimeloyl-ACP methyl ester carboxylesterase
MSNTIETRHYTGFHGLTLVADVGGDPTAPAVILQHGGGQTRHSWRGAMQKMLERGYHVINFDARGHGESGWADEADYGLEALAGDLRAVVATLPHAPALVGASMGGATSLYLAGTNSVPIAALVLVDFVPRIDLEGARKIQAFMQGHPEGFATLEEAADAVAAYNPHRPRPKDPSGLMKNLRLRADGRLHWHWDPKMMQRNTKVEPPQMLEPLNEMAKRVKIPTLVVRGMKSDVVSEAGIQDLRARIAHLEVFDVVGAGHMVAGDKNDAFNDGVLSFLQKHLPVKSQ